MYFCKLCFYGTNKKSSYKQHLVTQKHQTNQEIPNNLLVNKHECNNCNKTFHDRSGLWRHNKKCDSTQILNPKIILDIIHQHSEFKEMLIAQSKQATELQKQSQQQRPMNFKNK